MASLSSAPHHTRSNSLPTTSNLLASQLDEHLSRLRSSESASSSTTSSINSKLTHLSNLYDCIEEFLQLPSSIKALACQEKSWVDEALEGSIKALDICTAICDVLVQMKERVQDLQSILRRRCSEDEIAKEVAKYLRSRKMVVKALSKVLKKIENKDAVECNENKDVIRGLGECQMETLNVLESVLAVIVGPKAQRSNWESAVSKLLRSKRVTSQQETTFFLVGFEAMDVALHPKKAMSGLEKMEMCIKDVEQGLECLFRHLIKTRTTILNILSC